MHIRFESLAEGPGPSETLVAVQTVEGRQEEVVISRSQAQSGMLDVGSPLAESKEGYLVELPREAMSGRWRVWVARSQVVEAVEAAE